MEILNKSKNTALSIDAKLAKGFFDRVFGLLNKNNPRSMIFNTHFGIHTFGLPEPIDVLILDSSSRVVKLGKEIRPNNMFLYNPIHSVVIELPAGTIEKSNTRLNDKINLA